MSRCKSFLILGVCVVAATAKCAADPASGGTAADKELSRGARWVRSHPFTTTALTIVAATFDTTEYAGANLNTLLAWKARKGLFEKAVAAGLPWHMHVYPHREGLTDELKSSLMKMHDTYPGCTGWLVWDEPVHTGMLTAAPTLDWLRQTYPEALVYSNALPMGATAAEMFGGDPPEGGYSYEDYLRDFVNIMKGDIVCFDAYIFKEGGSTSNPFRTMSTVRRVALEAGVPYWAFVQSYSDPLAHRRYRMPSESDVRMQVFSLLAHGYTGIAYFTYQGHCIKFRSNVSVLAFLLSRLAPNTFCDG